MIQKEIIDIITNRAKLINRNLIEKDLILHKILLKLSSDNYFFENYAFKGGTCLIKCHLDYYRFSEDLDFTYINQNEFHGKSEKQKRKMLSQKINDVMKVLGGIAVEIGLDFKAVKNEIRYVELGSSNKQTTFKLWYKSEDFPLEAFIKVQINFLENIAYPIIVKKTNALFYKDIKAVLFLVADSEWIFEKPALKCYDIREILIEKARAILTRKSTKARDYIDMYMIEKKEKLNILDYKEQIIEKVNAVLKFEKYKTNFNNRLNRNFAFDREEEKRILLISLPSDFDYFFNRLDHFLTEILNEIAGS